MNNLFYRIARWFRPSLADVSDQRRMGGVADVITLLYSIPLAAIGLIWLARLSDFNVLRREWSLFLLLAILMILFNKLSFFLVTEIRSGGYANTTGAMDGIVSWTAILLFGPTGIWLDVLWNTVFSINSWRQAHSSAVRWNLARGYVTGMAIATLSALGAIQVYQAMGGIFPLSTISVQVIIQVMLALLCQFIIRLMIFSGYMGYVLYTLGRVMHSPIKPALLFFLEALGLTTLAEPFAILAAYLYVQHGLAIFMFFITGLLLVAFLTRRLSWAAESSRQQSRQLEELEKLGRAILNAPPDIATLPDILEMHVPAMFAFHRILIWLGQEHTLLKKPDEWSPDMDIFWNWLQLQKEPRIITTQEKLPWMNEVIPHSPVVIAPILDMESLQPVGGVYVELQELGLSWDARSLAIPMLVVQSLCAQVASALHQADVYTRTLEHQKTIQEISLARRIQASFLPEGLPVILGWQLSAILEPARDMAGDFYDFIPLPNGHLGILIADVADKGLGPALYMALSRTLIRTYAMQFEAQPEAVLFASNQRILLDSRANLFVTVFYGVLDPATGILTYCNAGHNPPYLFNTRSEGDFLSLSNTGMPLGIEEGTHWGRGSIQIDPGDVVLLYTDGIMDAQNDSGEFIDRKRLMQVARDHAGHTPHEMQKALLDVVHNFTGEAPRFDDITLVILKREG